MEMALNMNASAFAPLTFDELMEIDGGVNGWGIASGVLTVAAGGFAIAAAVVDPEPVSKAYAIHAGVATIGAGITGIVAACK